MGSCRAVLPPGIPATWATASFGCKRSAGWPGLRLAGHFTPQNAAFLRDGYGTPEQPGDTDLGSGGPTLLPGNTLIMGGKQGRIYVLDAPTMTLRQDKSAPGEQPPDWALAGVNPAHIGEGFQAFYNQHMDTDPRTPRALDNYASGEHWGCNIHGNPVYWPGTGCIYHMAEKDHLKAFKYDGRLRRITYEIEPDPVTRAVVPFAHSNEAPNLGMPGGAASVSSNGNQDGIVWVSYPQLDGQWQKAPGYLVAYSATPGRAGRAYADRAVARREPGPVRKVLPAHRGRRQGIPSDVRPERGRQLVYRAGQSCRLRGEGVI